MKTPKVSIVIPSFNAGQYLAQALKSVQTQTYKNYEVILIDDGSTDDTKRIAEISGIPIRYFYQKNAGISKARNAGLAYATGKYVAFLDADDIWLPEKLALQVKYLEENPDVGMVFSMAQNTLDPTKPFSNYPVIVAHVPPNCMFRREMMETVGLFDETISLGEFADWYARAIDMGIKVYSIPTLLLRRRIHGKNTGIKLKHHQFDYVRILKRKIDRAKLSTPISPVE